MANNRSSRQIAFHEAKLDALQIFAVEKTNFFQILEETISFLRN